MDLQVGTLPLLTSRLRLRPLHEGDAGRIAELANDPQIATNLSATFPSPYRLEDAISFLAADPNALGIELRDTVELIGVIGQGPEVEFPGVLGLGYWLGTRYWGQGLATEALLELIEQLRTNGTYRRLEASVYSWNPASARVLEKAGFQLEGRRRDRAEIAGLIGDELVFGLVL